MCPDTVLIAEAQHLTAHGSRTLRGRAKPLKDRHLRARLRRGRSLCRRDEKGALSPELRLLPVGSCCAENDGEPSGDSTRCVASFLPKVTARGRRSAAVPASSSVDILRFGPAF